MPLDQWSISVTLTRSNQMCYAYYHSIIEYGIIFWGWLFQRWEDFHFTKENCQNYGWSTTQNFM